MTDREFLDAVIEELERARAKFPSSELAFAALVEEVGEVAKALLDDPIELLQAELVQVAVMALRLAVEGDTSMEDALEKRMRARVFQRDLQEMAAARVVLPPHLPESLREEIRNQFTRMYPDTKEVLERMHQGIGQSVVHVCAHCRHPMEECTCR